VNIKPRNFPATLVAGLMTMLVTQAQAADYFLRIDGIPGESVDGRHAGQIEVAAWTVAATPSGTSGKTKVACIKDITFSKPLDKASPLLLANAVSGMTIPTATFVAMKSAGTATPFEYLRIELKDVVITSIADDGEAGDGATREQVTLGFGSFNLQYKGQKADGSPADVVQTTVKGGC
jgi:type VI secretion system secreted protein Hcp